MKGIDISSWQKGLDLRKVKTDFVIAKISEGRTWADPEFNTFYKAAKVPMGAYVFSYALTVDAARKEAQNALDLIKSRKLPLGVYIDVETPDQLSRPDLPEIVKAFCDEIRKAGYAAGAYGSELGLWYKVNPATFDGLVWVANWSSKPGFECDIWQYSDKVKLNGYGPLDGDEAMSERFKALVNGGEIPVPTPKETFSVSGIPVLKHGDTGDAVKVLQGELIALGYKCGGVMIFAAEKPDGIFGNVTEQSVLSFQRAHNLPETGIADKETRAVMLCMK